MKIVLNILGVILVLVGLVWILQGLNILVGSAMSGNSMWAINGLIAAVVGAVLLEAVNRRRDRTKPGK
jgi:hypothetical protein